MIRNILLILTLSVSLLCQGQKQPIDSAFKSQMAARLATYLNSSYPDTVSLVRVSHDKVVIKGNVHKGGHFALVEITPWQDVTETNRSTYRYPIKRKRFTVSFSRQVSRKGLTYDRALSKWAIVKTHDDGTDELVSHAHYADTITPTYSAKRGILLGKKGIAAGGGSLYVQDFDSLQAHSITMNILLTSVILKNQGPDTTPYNYGGMSYFINNATVSSMDKLLEEAQKRGIIVEGILLAPRDSYLRDPECDGGFYTMPNMTSPQSVNDYAAVLNFLAQRYSTGEHGRIHHWIMHNEVDEGKTWTNMGTQPMLRYLDRYVKSMRLCYNIVRQYDQHAFILASYTHSWTAGKHGFNAKNMLERTIDMSLTEGDFKWGVAYHPYPIDLTQPRFWKRDVAPDSFTRDARYVTFLNPEVINDWILNPKHFYKDKEKRLLFFSEQGTNSPTYSASDLTLQAAGAAWMWKKVKSLPGIDAMQWHNWMDNKAEDGLRIGLRAFQDESAGYKPFDKKPVWYVWQAAGTPQEDKVFMPYLKVLGLNDWNHLVQRIK